MYVTVNRGVHRRRRFPGVEAKTIRGVLVGKDETEIRSRIIDPGLHPRHAVRVQMKRVRAHRALGPDPEHGAIAIRKPLGAGNLPASAGRGVLPTFLGGAEARCRCRF